MPLLDREFLARLERLEIVSRRLRRGSRRGERRSLRRGTSVEFADHRQYGAGDDLRFLDWNMFARLDRLMIKLFHDEEDLQVFLVLDRSASMDFGDPTKALVAKRVLAAIGYVALLGLNRVHLWSPGEHGDVVLDNLRGRLAAERLFAAVEAAPVGGASGLDDTLRRWVGTRKPRGVLVLASDLLHPDGAWEHLRAVVRGGLETYCVRVLAQDEIDPELEGDHRLVDAEGRGHIDVSGSRALLDRYHAARVDYDRRLDAFCRGRRLSLLDARAETPIEHLVLEVLRRRGLLR